MPDLEPMLTPIEAARLLSLSRRSLDRRLDDGSIPFVKIGGAVRIPADAIADLMHGGKAGSRRRARQARAEAHAAAAATGGRS